MLTLNPYLITGPAVIAFSGGRTSGYMLHEIIAAHGGTLPPDVIEATTRLYVQAYEKITGRKLVFFDPNP